MPVAWYTEIEMHEDTINRIADAALAMLDASIDCRMAVHHEVLPQIAERVGLCNGMRRDTVVNIAEALASACKLDYGEGNPNNGRNPATIYVGMAGTFMFLARLPKAYQKHCGGSRHCLNKFDLIANQALAGGADEGSVWTDDDGDLWIRVWWD